MINKRNPLSTLQNIWFDAQQVDNEDLSLEQEYNDTVQSAIINNHIGAGVILESLEQPILFDSDLVVGFLDGLAIQIQNQPHDNNLGNQLEIELKNSEAAGKKTVKICLIGLDFNSNLQYETFVFKTNETQISYKHFTKILLIIFNDFIGNSDISLNLGGRIIIKEAKPLSISRDVVALSQDVEPNLFFRDFVLENNLSINNFLNTALPLYNTQTLNIITSEFGNKILSNGDFTTQIGQKFVSTCDNIQKITILLSVRNLELGSEDDLVWNGDLVVSIYPLQSTISSPYDIIPNLDIEFSPSNVAIAQISVNYTSLYDAGIVLDSVPQPIDFVFSNSPIASGNILVPGKYYVFTVKRAGAVNKCDLIISCGSNQIENSRITVFNGNLWVDIEEEDLWFKIWSDSLKVSDGQAYENGHGITIPKVTNAENDSTIIDNSMDKISFSGNDVYRAVLFSKTEDLVPVPDQKTGENVNSRKQHIPDINILNNLEISKLSEGTDLLILGAISDKNRKFYDSISSLISSKLYSASMSKDELIIRIVDDPTDAVRFDTSVNSLITNILNGDFVGAKIFPNINNPNTYYRIASSKLLSCILGDVNGDGIIDQNDLNLLNTYIGYDFNYGLPTNSIINTDSITTTYINGYNTYTQLFVSDFGINFQLVNGTTNEVVAEDSDGVLVPHPTNNRLAQFTSSNISFNNIVGLSSYKLVILTNSNESNHGAFEIIELDSITDAITIRKIYLTGESIMHMFRADIDGNFSITYEDGYLLQKYIEKYPLSYSVDQTFPGPLTDPFTKIGTRFNIIKFKLEKFIDRNDDYSIDPLDRFNNLHVAPDIFLGDGYFDSHSYYDFPVSFTIQKQLIWEDYLVVTNNKSKILPCIFHQDISNPINNCQPLGIQTTTYHEKPEVDAGMIDAFIPNNLIIGTGNLHRPDGNFYKVDFELGTIILEIPEGLFGSERSINILDDFIVDYTGDGRTRLGFPSMKFADCSYVNNQSLSNDQIRFSVSVQSISPTIDGYGDTKVGVYIDPLTGLLTLNFTGLFQDETLPTLSTKIQIHVFLKKGGFNNKSIFIDSLKMQNMLKLISVFSGPLDGGPSALVDLENDVSGILPIIHGGTGLNDIGAVGTVLTSTGSGLSYQFINQIFGGIQYSTGIADSNKITKTDYYGKLDPTFIYMNPVYIYGSAGIESTNSNVPMAIGAFPFRFDKYVLGTLNRINLEVILETTNAANTAQIRLFDVTNNNYIDLNGVSDVISTNATQATLVVSDDISYNIPGGAVDTIYEIHLSLSPSSVSEEAICKMARLTMTYNNPSTMPPNGYTYNFVPDLPPLSP